MKIFVRELNNHGIYEAFLEGHDKRLVVSRMPLLAAARALLKLGFDPDERLEMWREGKEAWDLAGNLGGLASLVVKEEQMAGPAFRRFKSMGAPHRE